MHSLSLKLCSFVLILSAAAAAQKPIQPRVVKIVSGKLLGVVTADQKVIAYKGVPYAAPPLAELRWRPPQPVAKWKRTLLASDFGSHCLQPTPRPEMVFRDPGPSEDCLTLNVWAPTAKLTSKQAGLPVMVWIYGGGYVSGGSSEPRQDGEFLARRGVIVVSMNYRLGVFGFLAHPELTSESANHTSGNYGLMDQTAALAWVRRNIAAFGGDPNNVTLFGESAGGSAVSAQVASPLTRGLIAKAICESGAAFYSFGPDFPQREAAEVANTRWAERAFGSSKLFYLRNLTADELLKAATTKTGVLPPKILPVVDGFFLPDTVPNIYAAGQQAHIPVLGGWNANEQHASGKPTAASFIAQAQTEFGPSAEGFLSVYRATNDDEALQSANDYASDRFITFSTWSWLEAQAKTGSVPVYRYFFDPGAPGDRYHKPAQGAFHTDEIEYVFGTLATRPEMAIRPIDRTISEQMGEYWTNFARTGDPNGPGLPRWLPYAASDDWQVLHLDAAPASKADNLRGRDLFLDSQWGRSAGK